MVTEWGSDRDQHDIGAKGAHDSATSRKELSY